MSAASEEPADDDAAVEDQSTLLIAKTQVLLSKVAGLLAKLDTLNDLHNLGKLKNRISKDRKFLNGLLKRGTLKHDPAKGSNYPFYDHFVRILMACREPVAVMKGFPLRTTIANDDEDDEEEDNADGSGIAPEEVTSTVEADIVCDGGGTWVKLKTQNARKIRDNFLGLTRFGSQKNIIESAEELVRAASQNVHRFKVPRVVFLFTHPDGVDVEVKEALEAIGVMVCTTRSFLALQAVGGDECKTEQPIAAGGAGIDDTAVAGTTQTVGGPVQDAVFLDVTTLVVLCTDLCHDRGTEVEFLPKHAVLNDMRDAEIAEPALPEMLAYMRGKRLLVCQTTADKFRHIASTLGGSKELARAEDWLARVTVVPDNPSDRALELEGRPRAHPPVASAASSESNEEDAEEKKTVPRTKPSIIPRKRSDHKNIVIFGTADKARTVIMTANSNFVRSARERGVAFTVFPHAARAFTETYRKRFWDLSRSDAVAEDTHDESHTS